MRRKAFLKLGAAVAAALMFSGMMRPAVADDAADKAAILRIWEAYSAARVAADYDAWLALWDKDGIKMSQGSPAIGYAMFDEKVAPKFQPGALDAMNIVSEEIVVSGDWAYSRGTYTSDWTDEGVPGHKDGKFLTILKRQPDGSWKIYRDHASANTK